MMPISRAAGDGLGTSCSALRELIVHSENQAGFLLSFRRWCTRTMAALMISAAVPWMGVFMAARSPKLHRLALLLFSSFSHRLRPYGVVNSRFDSLLAFHEAPWGSAQNSGDKVRRPLQLTPMLLARPKSLMPYTMPN